MADETEQLLRRIRLGEDSTLELKRVVVAGNKVSDPSRDAMSDERPFLMDRRGDGVPIIQEETLRLAGRPPEYTLIDDSELRLVLPGAGLDTVALDIG